MGIETGAPRIIKRYPNRKLYDTTESRYITLNEIATLIREGVELQVFDSRSGDDITSVTLAQVLVGEEKRRNRTIPIQKMAALIHSSGEFLQKKIPVVGTIREGAGRRVQEILNNSTAEEIREVLTNTQHAYEEVQRRADERIQFIVSTLKSIAPMSRDIQELSRQVRDLTARVTELERRSGGER